MLEQEQNQGWKWPLKNEWENSSQTHVSFEKSVMVIAKIIE